MNTNNTGIYTITCMVTTGQYVGSAIKLSKRDYDHFRDLKKGTHYNKKLQNAYNKYGSDNFIFEVLEYVDNKEDLIAREQYYIDTLKPKYNICQIAGSTLGYKHTEEVKLKISSNNLGIKRSEDTRQRMSEAKKNMSEETKLKMSKARMGNKFSLGFKHTEETKRKMSISQKNMSEETKRKMSVAKKGNKYSLGNKNMLGKKLSEETKLKISESRKGKKLSKEIKLKISESLSKPFKLLSPLGQIFEGINLAKFCKENNLHSGCMCEVVHNKRKSHKGWTKS